MSKPNKNRDRREMVEKMRQEAKAAERRRSLAIVSVCVVIAVVIIGIAAFAYISDQNKKDDLKKADLGSVGVAATAAGCEPVKTDDATGAGNHVTTPVIYETFPPSYGPHNPVPDQSGNHFYTADDRPDLEILVHNLEHGWTIVWYDETVADDADQMDVIKAAADKYEANGDDAANNVIFAPWTSDDGEGQPIPDDKHVAFTHWSIHQPVFDAKVFQDAADSGDDIPSFGESQYCSEFSGEALSEFTTDYPYDDAPEGYLWHR